MNPYTKVIEEILTWSHDSNRRSKAEINCLMSCLYFFCCKILNKEMNYYSDKFSVSLNFLCIVPLIYVPLCTHDNPYKMNGWTRKRSSRMHTAHLNSSPMYARPLSPHMPSATCMSPQYMHAPSATHAAPPPPVDRMIDTCLWKHYLPATSFAGCKNTCTCSYESLVSCIIIRFLRTAVITNRKPTTEIYYLLYSAFTILCFVLLAQFV